MKRCTGLLMMIVIAACFDEAPEARSRTAAVRMAAQQLPADEQQALRARIEQRYDVVPLTNGLALTPKTRTGDVRLIDISDTIAVNGIPVTGRELRERVGADADAILRLSYLDADARRALFAPRPPETQTRPPETSTRPETEPELESPRPSAPEEATRRTRRSSGDRVRVFGDVNVREDEEVAGQVVAVIGSARINGEVGQQVVAVLGSVDLGPRAVVHGDVVTVGGRLRRAAGAQVRGAITEVSLGDPGVRVHMSPWFDGWGPIHLFGGFGPVARLLGSTFRFVLLVLLAGIVLVVARRPVEASAQRVADNPVNTTLVGMVAWVLFAPAIFLTALLLAISFIGIPLLLLLPFAVLTLLLMALVGFSGTAFALGQWMRRRLGIGTVPAFVDVFLGILVILAPLLLGRLMALGGWPLSPFVFLLVATGLAVEFLAWSSGFGAVLTNAFSRWQARRATRRTAITPTPTPGASL